MKKTLLAVLCMSMAYMSWGQKSSVLFNLDIGLGIPSEEARAIADPSGGGTFVVSTGIQKPVMQVHKSTKALVGLQFTHISMTHDDKHSPSDFGEVTHDLETNTSMVAPTIRFETSIGNFFPYVEAGAGLMTQRSNIVTTTETDDFNISNCSSDEVTRTKVNDMQTQFGLQSSVGLAYGKDNWKLSLSANFMKGTQSFLMPERSSQRSTFNFDDVAGDQYHWKSVRPDIMHIKLGIAIELGRCMAK